MFPAALTSGGFCVHPLKKHVEWRRNTNTAKGIAMGDMYEDSAEEEFEKEPSFWMQWILYTGTLLVFWPILLFGDMSDGYEGPDSANLKAFFGACATTVILIAPVVISITRADVHWWHGLIFAVVLYIIFAIIFFRVWR